MKINEGHVKPVLRNGFLVPSGRQPCRLNQGARAPIYCNTALPRRWQYKLWQGAGRQSCPLAWPPPQLPPCSGWRSAPRPPHSPTQIAGPQGKAGPATFFPLFVSALVMLRAFGRSGCVTLLHGW